MYPHLFISEEITDELRILIILDNIRLLEKLLENHSPESLESDIISYYSACHCFTMISYFSAELEDYHSRDDGNILRVWSNLHVDGPLYHEKVIFHVVYGEEVDPEFSMIGQKKILMGYLSKPKEKQHHKKETNPKEELAWTNEYKDPISTYNSIWTIKNKLKRLS